MLDYWRNADKDITLTMRYDGSYWFNSEWDNDVCQNRVTKADLNNLLESIKFILELP